jgi:hypothetical protein
MVQEILDLVGGRQKEQEEGRNEGRLWRRRTANALCIHLSSKPTHTCIYKYNKKVVSPLNNQSAFSIY